MSEHLLNPRLCPGCGQPLGGRATRKTHGGQCKRSARFWGGVRKLRRAGRTTRSASA